MSPFHRLATTTQTTNDTRQGNHKIAELGSGTSPQLPGTGIAAGAASLT